MQALKGSLVALVTPLSSDGEVDYTALKGLVEWHIEQGTHGIVSVGTTGEAPTLSVNEHSKVIAKTVEYVNARVPVIAGTGGNSTRDSIALTKHAKEVGADFCLLVTPYYNKPNQEGLLRHFLSIAESVDIPQILYNVPSRTACDILPSTVKILANHKNIVGIKEALDDMNRIKELIEISYTIRNRKDFYIYSGDDPTFLASMELGTHGVISVVANAIPNQIASICNLALNKDFVKAHEINKIYNDLYNLCFVESNPIPIKWIMYKLNKVENNIRLPLIDLNETFHEKIMSEMVKLKLI
ncbi:4-hydroxy-tetrahydrodipicolinate synthase [Gammaproteobacteria bacterium]|nr:4-hydroxy-tetrahydrodipicolinate synthase [Gammaproteobacteria bacterium]|tara:strand:+ start:2863 stop:3759 length:897 start_codon:yes stop_codon:yes gene_type:complete